MRMIQNPRLIMMLMIIMIISLMMLSKWFSFSSSSLLLELFFFLYTTKLFSECFFEFISISIVIVSWSSWWQYDNDLLDCDDANHNSLRSKINFINKKKKNLHFQINHKNRNHGDYSSNWFIMKSFNQNE